MHLDSTFLLAPLLLELLIGADEGVYLLGITSLLDFKVDLHNRGPGHNLGTRILTIGALAVGANDANHLLLSIGKGWRQIENHTR